MSVRENRSGRQTKEWILETACRLFNDHGTAAISTKRIAKEMGISPGNLYYHFKNKEEIILALFEANKDAYWDDWVKPDIPPLHRFLDVARSVVMMWQDCRFFKKEMVMLVENDPRLRQGYQEMTMSVRQSAEKLFRDLAEAGFVNMQKLFPNMFDSLLTISTIVANHWLTHLDLEGLELNMENLHKGAELILLVWRPYLTDAALAQIDTLEENVPAN